MIAADDLPTLKRALPFWLPLALVPVAFTGVAWGGLWTLLLPVGGWIMFILLDGLTGTVEEAADPNTPDEDLRLYKAITLIWPAVQVVLLFTLIWLVANATHLSTLEKFAIFFGMGTLSGTIGINYAHELMHQKTRSERWLGDILMSMVLYAHFRSEHLLVHHRLACTGHDPATARFGETFWQFFPRILVTYPRTSFAAEVAMLARRGLPWWHRTNPFWRFAGLQLSFVVLALILGGWLGLSLFVFQAAIAVMQLEMVNYVEHYGLSRKHLGGGKYEPFRPHHSWNSSRQASNWLLINLQRHSDHHVRPDRRFPLLQPHIDDAPQLPFGYPVMTLMALVPPLWRRVMFPRVEAWRAQHYPEISDWSAYDMPSRAAWNVTSAPLPPN